MIYVDATCPLVSKVHREAERHSAQDRRHIMLIGHAGHPEVVGTLGPIARRCAMTLVETVAGRRNCPRRPRGHRPRLRFSQTTLSVDDTSDIIADTDPPLPGYRRAEAGGHLLCDHEPPSRRQDQPRRTRSSVPGGGRRELVELEPAWLRSRRLSGAAEAQADRPRARHRLGLVRRRAEP